MALLIVVAGSSGHLVRNRKRDRDIRVLQGTGAEIRNQPKFVKRKRLENEHYLWGGEFLDDEQASLHFLALGSTGSGKTINILLLMRSVIKRLMEPGSDVRAVVYDSKTDLLSTIKGMGVSQENLVILNPFDERRRAWDLAKDITTPAEADDMATLLIPADPSAKDPYFAHMAQRFLSGVIQAFQFNAPGQWTLRDLVLSAKDPEILKRIFLSCRYTQDLCRHFGAELTSENVRSTMDGRLLALQSVAASWHRAKETFTIGEWMKNQQVLVLGNSPKGRDPIRRINQLLFTSLAKEVLGKPGRERSKHWFFLDELRELGELDYLADMMIVGRSKGASMILGFQDVHGLYAEYGKERASEIIGCTQNFALLRINATQPETQKWASDVAGQLRYRERKRSYGTSSSNGGSTTSENVSDETKTESIYIPSYFSRQIPQTNGKNGMVGVYFTKEKLYEVEVSPEVLFHSNHETYGVPQPDEQFPDHVQMADDQFLLERWDQDDMKRLGIPEVPSEMKEVRRDQLM